MNRKNIRDFDCIREVVEHIYTYGFYTREDFIRKGNVGSPRAYDDIIRQLRDLYFLDIDEDSSVLEGDTHGRGKYKCYKFKRNYFSNAGDQLAATFGLFAVSDNAIANTIRCLSLAASSDGATISNVSRVCADGDGTDYGPTISRRLNSLRQAGYLVRDPKTNRLNDTLKNLSDVGLIQLYYLTSFYAGAGYPRVPAIFLRETLRRYMAYRGLPEPCEAFLFRDNACGNVFDEQVVYELLQCCQNHTAVEIVTAQKHQKVRIKPVYLKIDTRLGRWYLFAVCDDEARIMRVSNIKKVKVLNEDFDYTQEAAKITNAFQYNYISGQTSASPIPVEAELNFGTSPLRMQFEREMLIGTITQREGKEYYHAEVNDVLEIKPFLRCYGAYIRILPSDRHTLDQDLLHEYERMLSKYGAV